MLILESVPCDCSENELTCEVCKIHIISATVLLAIISISMTGAGSRHSVMDTSSAAFMLQQSGKTVLELLLICYGTSVQILHFSKPQLQHL